MTIRRARCNDYILINDVDVEMNNEVGFDEPPEKCCSRKCRIVTCVLISILLSLLFLAFIVVFVILPLIFMNSINLQRQLVFTRFNLPENDDYFAKYKFPSFQNHYVEVSKDVNIGVWHILPEVWAYEAIHNPEFDYQEALNSPYPVVIYFHGTGETRGDSGRTYQLLTRFFHVIAFDYRGYGDSSKADLSEEAVVNDSVQLFNWVRSRTKAYIFLWGHSLGAAIAVHTAAVIGSSKQGPVGLIIESGFTNLRDELYVHPYGKIFAWLPWFSAAILNPLHKNGFIFDTATHITKIKCPIMILHAQDDTVIPVKFGKELYNLSASRKTKFENNTIYHEFDKELGYNHYYVTTDPFLKYYIMDFSELVDNTNALMRYMR